MPNRRLLLPFLFSLMAVIFLFLYLFSGPMTYPIYYSKMKVKAGDSLQWGKVNYQDGKWESRYPFVTMKNWWVRVPITTTFKPDLGKPGGIAISMHGSYQVFWDGILIGESGKWANSREAEVEGPRNNVISIPDSLLHNSAHLLALRISSFNDTGREIYPRFTTGSYFALARGELKHALFFHVLAGTFLVIFFYYLFLYFISYRYKPYLLFALLCGCFFSMIVFEYMRSYNLYPYSFHFKRLSLIGALAFLTGNILTLFLLKIFTVKKQWLIAVSLNGLLVSAWLARTSFDDKTKAVSLFAFTVALFICLWAIIQRRKYSSEAFYGVLSCLMCHINYDKMIYVGFSLLVLFMLFALSRQIKSQVRSHQEIMLRSKRLEIELLKLNIRPHFLMNSLTSLMEWVERSPQKSNEFIHALATEFEILDSISSKKLIPLQEEVALCKAHLAIMSFRRDIEYEFEYYGPNEDDMVPPAMLLTLIENGLSHNIIEGSTARFELHYETTGEGRIYRLFAPGKASHSANREGTGLNYIKARLEESYGDGWAMKNGPVAGGWQTIITVK